MVAELRSKKPRCDAWRKGLLFSFSILLRTVWLWLNYKTLEHRRKVKKKKSFSLICKVFPRKMWYNMELWLCTWYEKVVIFLLYTTKKNPNRMSNLPQYCHCTKIIEFFSISKWKWIDHLKWDWSSITLETWMNLVE